MTKVTFDTLVELMERLRGPQGCPWDKEQTYETLGPMTIEEAYELLEAIENKDVEHLKGELGDLLFQVVFYSKVAKERGEFTIEDVMAHVYDKMVRRHPHVFGEAPASTSNEVLLRWEKIKLEEKSKAGSSALPSVLDGVSTRIPALIEASQLTARASRVGFDWDRVQSAIEKLEEEVTELKHALAAAPEDKQRAKEEIGDLLFMTVNVARLLGIDAETALKAANRKFKERFRHIERELHRQGRSLEESSIEEMESLWEQAKAISKGNPETS